VISVIDYGAGNLRSVLNAIEAVGGPHELVRDPANLERAEKIILPGVGHFGQMMRALDRMNLRGAIHDRIRAGIPFFGICLGLHALFERSEEAPEETGLGVLDGIVKRFDGRERVPHMGWNRLTPRGGSRLLSGLDRPYVYFANSFYAPPEHASAMCDYGIEFAAVIEHANISAVQFHPEKSGAAGLQIVRNFVCS